MNRINPGKLLHSKWTATRPQNRERHFIVNQVDYDEEGRVTRCELQAVLTRRSESIDWRSLKDPAQWQHGWQ